MWIELIRGVRGHGQKRGKNSVKLGKNTKNRLKRKEKAEILVKENFQKWGNQLMKIGTLTPLINFHVTHIMHFLSGVQYLYVCCKVAPGSFKAPGQPGAHPVIYSIVILLNYISMSIITNLLEETIWEKSRVTKKSALTLMRSIWVEKGWSNSKKMRPSEKMSTL